MLENSTAGGDYKHRKWPQVTARDLKNTTRDLEKITKDHKESPETTRNLDEMDETIVGISPPFPALAVAEIL